ncbi:putative reverse transcriptase domain-containing protein [Tanacetum coccineum]
MEKDCRVRLQGAGNDFLQNVTCFGCGEKGHFKDKCPKTGNQQNDGARGRAYVVIENPQQNPNVVTGTFLLNDHYACILFDSGAEKSFVSSAFTHFIDIAPATLNTSYEIELADGKVVSTNTILRSSFDVIIGMDWLAYHRPLIDCYEKIIRIPLSNDKILEVQGERPEKDLRSLACIKADEKKLDDIRVVRDFPEVFPDDLLGLPLVREIEFRIDMIPGASLLVRSPYWCFDWLDSCRLQWSLYANVIRQFQDLSISIYSLSYQLYYDFSSFTSLLTMMAASAIAISSDSSDESVGSPPSRVILFGDIRTVIPSTSVVAPEISTIAPVISSAAPVVETTLVASPTGLCGLIPYSDSFSDLPDEMSSPEHIFTAYSYFSPFLCTDFFWAPDSYDGTPIRRTIMFIPLSISGSQPYRTHLNGSRKLLTARKRVGPLPARRLAWRHASPCSSDHHPSSSSSSSDSSPVHSSGLDASDQAHSGSSTRDVPPRLCYPPRRAPRRRDSSERPLHSSLHSGRPSRKRCRSPVYSVPSSTQVMGSLAPTRADLLPPRKRVWYCDEDDVRDHIKIDPRDVRDDREEYQADTSARDTVEVGIDPMSAPIVEEEIVEPAGEDYSDSSGTRDGIVRIVRIKTVQRRLEADQLIARGQRVSVVERIDSLRLENLKVRAMLDIERDRVNSLRLHMSLSQEEFCQVRRDRDDTRGRLRRTMTNTRSGMTHAAIEEMINQRMDAALEARRVNRDLKLENGNDNGRGNGNENGNGNGTGNGNNGGDNGDSNENRNVNGRGDRPVARECTYQDFYEMSTTGFKGTKGVRWLIRWSEKMETVFHISNCPKRYQVKYATYTLLDSALTWWNSHKRTIKIDAAYAFKWRALLR